MSSGVRLAGCKLIRAVVTKSGHEAAQSSLVIPAILALSEGTLTTASMYNNPNASTSAYCQVYKLYRELSFDFDAVLLRFSLHHYLVRLSQVFSLCSRIGVVYFV